MNFNDIVIFKEDGFSVGQEKDLKKYYLSIPVSNGLIEYEEYYEIEKEVFDRFSDNIAEIRILAGKCRRRENDENLIIKPGKMRGSPI